MLGSMGRSCLYRIYLQNRTIRGYLLYWVFIPVVTKRFTHKEFMHNNFNSSSYHAQTFSLQFTKTLLLCFEWEFQLNLFIFVFKWLDTNYLLLGLMRIYYQNFYCIKQTAIIITINDMVYHVSPPPPPLKNDIHHNIFHYNCKKMLNHFFSQCPNMFF